MFRITPLVRNLLAVNFLVFLVQMLFPGMHVTEYLSLWSVGTGNFRPYQLFTYMFVHDSKDVSHIFFNMIALVFFGPILETVWGPMRFLSFYIICGIGAGLFNTLVDLYLGQGFGIMLGASGAVYGVMTAFGVLFPNMEIQLLFPPIRLKAKYMVTIFGLIALYSAFNRAPGDHVAHFAHLGGIIVAIIQLQFWRFRGG